MAPVLSRERRAPVLVEAVEAPALTPARRLTLSSADARAGTISARGAWQPTRLRAHRLAHRRHR
jgi:hypothetical protein